MIRLENVTKVYSDGTEAVRDVSFEVPKGETASLVGPSGCGKTTTMTMVNRLTEITEGEIYVDGTPVSEYDPIELRRNIGYVIQEIGLFDHMTVGENISLVPDLLGWEADRIDERVEELVDLIRLPEGVRDRYPDQLSGGQQQRVGVARALAAEPDILLMDEPFGALDPITREQLQDEFLEIQRGLAVTIVFVTHDVDEALKMGDRVAVLDDGELVQYAAPRELLANPASEFVESFLGADRLLKQLQAVTVAEVMTADPAAAADLPTGTALAPTDTLKDALQAFLQHDSPLAVVEGRQPVGVVSEAAVRDAVSGDREVLTSDRE